MKEHAPAYILIFKTRQFYYDTHTVRAKHASVDALTPQESCNKVCLTGCVSQGRNDCWSGHHQSHAGSLYLQWIVPAEAKGSQSKKRKNDAVTKQL